MGFSPNCERLFEKILKYPNLETNNVWGSNALLGSCGIIQKVICHVTIWHSMASKLVDNPAFDNLAINL